jgi:hypothetical protein
MPFDRARARPLLQSCDLPKLFVEELGWEPCRQKLTLRVGETDYAFVAIAEKRHFIAWLCTAPGGGIPDHATRLKLDRQLSETSYEHLIIFATADRARQNWVWVRKETGKPLAVRTHEYHRAQPGDSLLQKLEALYVSIEEEEAGDLSTLAVAGRARAAFDVEKVTKKFYKDFDSHRKTFLGFIQGIPDTADRDWYASVMLNRLMFVYFIQRKGFLSGDRDYLRNRLALCQKDQGKNKFYNFYRYFLLRLFHEGFGKRRRDRAPDLEKLLGTIPYLNGGLFDVHELEREERYGPAIQIKDEAFQKIFNYFDQYQWHLDERPLRADNEINPDVLGYIFEQYINNKQMGAYYTKEDITEYIGKSCLIPFLVDSTRAKCRVAFEGAEGATTVWHLLKEYPDRYIYPAVKHGTAQPLPAEIEAGVADVSCREGWNRPASSAISLPTETWREVVARRQRYAEVHARLAAGEVREINDFITFNLDLWQFAQDLVQNAEGPDLLTAFWQAISTITVLDPTGGSGAFIFAALNILEPLYEGCLDRMEDFLEGWGEAGKKLHPNYHKKFSDVLANVAKHPNRRYFILKSIILNNLYAVDIMEEAVEICKLRLFLKLASQVEPDPSKDNLGIEPLPDIDFNIRAGNTLVGYATYDEVKRAFTSGLDFENAMGKIETKAADLQQTFDKFRQLQTEGDGSVPYEHKVELQKRLTALENELNRHLAGEYGVKVNNKEALLEWKKTHQPFHWFIQFYGILNKGGFDIIIGNPPYVEYAKIKEEYTIRNYVTERCGNLYAYVMERCLSLAKNDGYISFIVPTGSISSERTAPLQEVCLNNLSPLHLSHFSAHGCPSTLFEGAFLRLTIITGRSTRGQSIKDQKTYSSKYMKWYGAERHALFQSLYYWAVPDTRRYNSIPKVENRIAAGIWHKLIQHKPLGNLLSSRPNSNRIFYYNAPLHWTKAFDFLPRSYNERDGLIHGSHYKDIYTNSNATRYPTIAALNSHLFYLWFIVAGNCRDLSAREVESFPFSITEGHKVAQRLERLAKQLMESYKVNATMKIRMQKTTGRMELQEIDPRKSADIIKDIDRELAGFYGFTPQELDFIQNYDSKYRLGAESDLADE